MNHRHCSLSIRIAGFVRINSKFTVRSNTSSLTGENIESPEPIKLKYGDTDHFHTLCLTSMIKYRTGEKKAFSETESKTMQVHF